MSSFLDRLNTARYISPSGQIILFDFEVLTRTNEKKVTVQELPFQDSGVIKPQGNTVVRHPITAYIYGKDYDLVADRFFKALRESGVGTLNHPRWGEIKVIPLTYTQREKFVNDIRYAEFTIDFVEYTEKNSPLSKQEQKSKFLNKLDSFKKAVSLDFLNRLDLRSLLEQTTAMKAFRGLLDGLESGLSSINQLKSEVKNQYDTILRNINRVNGLIEDAESTIDSIVSLSFLGIESGDSIGNSFNDYQMTQSYYQSTFIPNASREHLPTALQTEVFAGCTIGALSAIVTDYEFNNKPEAITALNSLQEAFESFIVYQESLQDIFSIEGIENSYIMGNDTMVYLNELVSIGYSYILNQLYDLKVEQKIILDKEIDPISLAKELYGTIERLDDLIDDNKLSEYELFLLPIGKEIKIYV